MFSRRQLFGAAALVFVVDTVRYASDLIDGWIGPGGAVFDALGVVALMLAGDVALVGLVEVIGRLARWAHTNMREAGVGAGWSTLALAGLAALPFAIFLSAGDGLARLMPRWVSLPVIAAVLAAAFFAAVAVLRRLSRWLAAPNDDLMGSTLVAVGLLGTAIGALVAHRHILWGLYPAFHFLMVVGGIVAALVAFTEPADGQSESDESEVSREGRPTGSPWSGVAMLAVGLAVVAVARDQAPAAFTRALLTGTGTRPAGRVIAWAAESMRPPVPPPQAASDAADGGLQPGATRPHVIVVSIDGVRASHVGFLGHERQTTPFLDSLAPDARIFRRAYSPAANTASTLLQVLSKGTIGELAQTQVDDPEQACRRFEPSVLLPREFSEGGYRSVCDITYAQGHLACAARGCDVAIYADHREQAFDLVLEQLRSTRRPVFAFMHLLETHHTYTGFDQQIVEQTPGWTRYERSIRGMDRAIGAFFGKVEQLSERPVVWVFVSDHGEAFGEHGFEQHDSSLYDEQVHVPLMLYGPGIEPSEVDTPVSTAWLFDTLRPLVGQAPRGPVLPLRSDEEVSAPVFLHNRRWFGVVEGRWKYIEDRSTGGRWLFDLKDDPDEQHSSLGERPERAARMRRQIDAHFRK